MAVVSRNHPRLLEIKKEVEHFLKNPITADDRRNASEMMTLGGGPILFQKMGKYHDYRGVPTSRWREKRVHGPFCDDPTHPQYEPYIIGASTAARITNLGGLFQNASKWSSMVTLYYEMLNVSMDTATKEKVARIREHNRVSFEGNKAAVRGHLHEESALYSTTEREGWDHLEVKPETDMYSDPLVSFVKVNPDAWGRNKGATVWDKIIQVKTLSAFNREAVENWKNDIIPEDYEVQTRIEMAVMNTQEALVTVSWGLDPDEGRTVSIKRDYQIEADIFNALVLFVKHLIDETPPSWDNVKDIDLRMNEMDIVNPLGGDGTEITLTEEVAEMILEIDEKETELKELEKTYTKPVADRIKYLKAEVRTALGESSKGTYVTEDKVVIAQLTKSERIGMYRPEVNRLIKEDPDKYGDLLRTTTSNRFTTKVMDNE